MTCWNAPKISVRNLIFTHIYHRHAPPKAKKNNPSTLRFVHRSVFCFFSIDPIEPHFLPPPGKGMEEAGIVAVGSALRAYRLLNGLFCAYKPSGIGRRQMRRVIGGNLCRDLNEMPVTERREKVRIEGDPVEGELTVRSYASLSTHPLVVGPRFVPEDLRIYDTSRLDWWCSGVELWGIGRRGCGMAMEYHDSRPVKVYEVGLRLGVGTDSFDTQGKVVEKATYGHVSRVRLDSVLAGIQAAHQKNQFLYSGVDPQSQEAFDLACKGLLRPAGNSPPLIYGIACTEFRPPDATLRLQCVNETVTHLKVLVNDVGLALKTVAACTGIRCVRVGPFTADHALLRKHWTLEHVLNNIGECHRLVGKVGLMPKDSQLRRIDQGT
ncbi:unnamed protein product [Darwinula stevensoni]|uniref:Pseudouridine synthase II N-terminal domain-containing protein n=1 Tax=Darwinula stevensoni TaxID=69355 RepID=A0A7R8X7U4_9CRUS|nr:unnamed protein product [Darwinula stevensoni]CAG0888129.1 unnamed protein product [Darwinula stevensoni]